MINAQLAVLQLMPVAGEVVAYRTCDPDPNGDEFEASVDTAVVFLHGMGNSSAVWGPVHSAVAARGVTAFAVDIPGHGQSTLRRKRPDFSIIADLLDQFVQRLDVPRIVVVGHSLGAVFALELALRLPQRIASVLIIAGPPLDMMDLYDRPWKTLIEKPRVLKQFSLLLLAGLPGAGVASRAGLQSLTWVRTTVRRTSRPPVEALDPAHEFALQHLGSGRIIGTTLGGFGRNYREPYRDVAAPCVVVLGADDRLTDVGEITEYFETLDAPTEVQVWAGVGHMPMLDAMPRTVSIVLSLARDVS